MDPLIRQIRLRDAAALAAFYNALSPASKRTFRPLGETATTRICAKVARENVAKHKYDLIACDGSEIVGWGFLWDLQSDHPTLGLGISDTRQGQGLGHAFMDALLAEGRRRGLPRITLTVVQDNDRAWRMYERRQFVRQEAFVAEDGLPYYRMTNELT